MSRLIKILHIDPDHQITYLIYLQQSSFRTTVPLETAIAPLKKEDFAYSYRNRITRPF